MFRIPLRSGRRVSGLVACLLTLFVTTGRLQTPPPVFALARISAGALHSLALDGAGAVWSWGNNAGGQLGDSTNTDRFAPTLIVGAVGTFTSVAAGGTHSLALRSDGRVLAWGANVNGEIGDGTTTQRRTPVLVPGVLDAVSVAAGVNHSLALRANGTVVAWGLNSEGQLGENSRTRRLSPVAVSGLSNVIAVAAGGVHSLALTGDGRVFAWGDGSAGQLGLNSTSDRLVPTQIPSLVGIAGISAGAAHSAAVTSSGSLRTWGNNATFQLGDGTQTTRLTPVTVAGISGATAVSAGAGHTLARTSGQVLYGWGSNAGSQLGDGATTNRPTPIAITPPGVVTAVAAGGVHSLVLAADGSVWSAGTSTTGQAGDGTTTTVAVFAPISGPAQAWGVFGPTLSPSSGTFSAPQVVTATTPRSGATIRYTTTGADPTATSTAFPPAGLVLSAPATLKARAFKPGMAPSSVTAGVYAFAANPPIATPGGGAFAQPQSVTLSTTTPGAIITYTLNGSDPTEGSTPYAAPFVIASSATLKTRAFRAGWQPSATLTFVYTFSFGTLATPTATPPAGSYPSPQTVVLSAEPGGTIRYTLGGADPSESSTAYAGPISIPSSTTLKARAFRADWTPSAILTATYVIEQNTEPLPPDPSTVATPINPAVLADFADTNQFLYSAPDPIQRGATASAFDAERLAIVRGRVLDPTGTPLPGARITILDNAAFGHTLSRADGMYDMAVNGGGAVVVDIRRAGYLPVQRRVEVAGHAWGWADDVRLTPVDATATPVRFDAGSSAQVARGSLVHDGDGQRRVALMVPEGGVHARIELADGTILPDQAQLTIRATEYTVGPNGPDAMPATLPATSAYTYAVELSADEADQAGAVKVTFDPALVFYLENFLDGDVGTAVPAGSYDRIKGAWVAERNGRIVRTLSEANGLAELDIDGSGTAATPEALADLGVTVRERQQLATLYEPGQALWRVPVPHFSPWDLNWPYGLPADARDPNNPAPVGDRQDDDPCEEAGSIIECQNQTLGERLPIAGTPFTLNYRSNRHPGRTASRAFTAFLTQSSVSPSLEHVLMQVQVAGQRWFRIGTTEPNQSADFAWDGRDAYGRALAGAQPATVLIQHSYKPVRYAVPEEAERSFALPPASATSVMRSRQTNFFYYRQFFTLQVGDAGAPSAPVAGWSVDVHHTFDPRSRTLYLGTGERRTDVSPGMSVRTAAGGGTVEPSATPTPGRVLRMPPLRGVAALPDGSVLLTSAYEGASPFASRTFRMLSDGRVVELPIPSETEDFFGRAVAVDGAGRIYLAEAYDFQGSCSEGGSSSGVRVLEATLAGGLTTLAEIALPSGGNCGTPELVADRDGTLYLSVKTYIYRIGLDRIPVLQHDLSGSFTRPQGLALGTNGALYFTSSNQIERITAAGVREVVAGTGDYGYSGDGGPALAAQLTEPRGIAARADGSLLFMEATGSGESRVRRIGPDGIISTIAGGGPYFTSLVEGAPAVGQNFGTVPLGVFGLAPDGGVLVPTGANSPGRLYRVAGEVTTVTPGTIQLPSADGSEVYVFDASGRHRRTVDALLGHTLFAFSYDAAGQLVGIRDRDGLDTLIEREASGQPRGMVAPFGQRTTLLTNAEGYLQAVSNPAGDTVQLGYAAGGLLTSLTTPRNHSYAFNYDSLGRLVSDSDPAGGVQTLERTNEPSGWGVTLSHTVGTSRSIRHDDLPTGYRQYVAVGRDGTSATQTQTTDGGTLTVAPDGTRTATLAAPDPRFGMQAPIGASTTISTPGGRVLQATSSRVALSADAQNPLSLTRQTDTTLINGRPWRQILDVPTRTVTATTPTSRTTTTVFDAAGRVTQITPGNLLPVSFAYTPLGQVETVTQGTRTTRFSYDGRGRVQRVTDPLSREVLFAYDMADRVISQTLPGGRVVGFGYDGSGNVTTVTPPGQTAHGFDHTPVDRPERYDPPVVTPGGATTSTYRTDRRVETVTRPDGQTIAIAYDPSGRPSTLTTPAGSTTWSYDATSGLVTSLAAPDASVGIAYDGSLPTSVTWTGAISGSVGVTYDNFLRPSSETVNGASSAAFTYDLDNLLTGAGALTIVRHPGSGLVTGTTLSGLAESRTSNGFGELTARTFTRGGTSLYSASYTRDAIGRIESKTENIQGVAHTEAYTYDLAGRLETVTRDGTLITTFGYDANGNRTSTIGTGGNVSASFDAQDRLHQSGATTYTYASGGELLTKTEPNVGTTTYSYDVHGNLGRVALPTGTVIQYQVDGLNRRIGRLVNGVRTHGWLWSGTLRPVAEVDAAGTLVSRFVYGTAINVPDYLVRGSQTYRLVTDHLGSVRLVVDVASGVVVQQLAYDAWGQVTLDTNPGWQPFGFAGGLYDPATGLVRFGARDYDASVGRWTSKDPIGFDGGDSNQFAYVGGDPVGRLDPSGLDWVDVGLYHAANFSAGFGDYLSFGLTRGVRRVFGYDDVIDRCSAAYVLGDAAGVGVDLGVTAASLGLNGAAKGAATAAHRAYAREAMQAAKGEIVHHVMPLKGHMPLPGQFGARPTFFPTAGLPASIANHPSNLKVLADRAAHQAEHQALYNEEAIARAMGYGDPAATSGRLLMRCGCN